MHFNVGYIIPDEVNEKLTFGGELPFIFMWVSQEHALDGQ